MPFKINVIYIVDSVIRDNLLFQSDHSAGAVVPAEAAFLRYAREIKGQDLTPEEQSDALEDGYLESEHRNDSVCISWPTENPTYAEVEELIKPN